MNFYLKYLGCFQDWRIRIYLEEVEIKYVYVYVYYYLYFFIDFVDY